MLAKNEIIRKVILDEISVTSAQQVIQIEQKIPSHILKCVGVFALVNSYVDTTSQRIKIGEFSLQFNNQKVHPINWLIGYDRTPSGRLSYPLTLNEPMYPGELIDGHYFDANTAYKTGVGPPVFQPYKVLIILECIAQRKADKLKK
ncbi:MAG: hypothetical protein WC707_06985 [Candidatus Babeliaceae bacterium]|jgi:hypothetical protein